VTPLGRKVQNALDEARILILGAQVLLGFGLRSTLETRFDALPRAWQWARLGSIALLLAALVLLIAPGPFHQIVERGRDTARLHRFTLRAIEAALAPFAIAIAVDFAGAGRQLYGVRAGIVAGAAAAAVALGSWYGVELLALARRRGEKGAAMQEQAAQTSIHDRIRHVLTEARVVLPGAQALLGFQLATMLLDGFARLPRSSQAIHFASLSLIALATIWLIAPAAFHRIVERGEDTERFHRVASRLLLAALVPLALGIAGDVFVVARKVSGSTGAAAAFALAVAACALGWWFGVPLAAARRPRHGWWAGRLRTN